MFECPRGPGLPVRRRDAETGSNGPALAWVTGTRHINTPRRIAPAPHFVQICRGQTLDHRQDNPTMRTSMIANRICASALSAAVTVFSFVALAKAPPFDGSWHMQLVTTSGHCGVIDMGM